MFSACFGLLQFVSLSFGMTTTPKLVVSTKKQNNQNKRFVSIIAIASLRSNQNKRFALVMPLLVYVPDSVVLNLH